MEESKKTRKKLDYKWVIVALCFLMVFTCLGFCSSNKSLYTFAITEALEIPRSAYSLNDTLRFITTAVVNMFFGSMVHKYGTKKLICAGFISLILSCFAYSLATNVFAIYLGGCLLGIGLSWTTTTMVGCVVNKWCKENKGTIMGVILCSNGLGGALAAQIVSPIIYEEGNAFGYRHAYHLVALFLLFVFVLIALFFKEQPKNYDNSQPIVTKKKSRGQSWIGIEYAEARKKGYYYATLVCIFLTGFVLQGVNGVAAVHMKDIGLDAVYVATVLSAHSIALAGFKFLTGFLYDRFGLKITMNICSLAAVVAMLSLAVMTNSQGGMVLAMVYGIISSLALPLETIMLPIYASDLFGEKSFDHIMGKFVSFNVLGYSVAAFVMGLCYDAMGTYQPALIVCAVIMVGIMVSMQFVLNTAHRCRDTVLEEQEELLE